MIKVLTPENEHIIYEVINKAARAYKGFIPDDCYYEPYMPKEELRQEMGNMTFFGWEEKEKLVGCM